ncbi:MAG: hypothetical protein PHP52_05950 [Bacteroidales bacterium]|nr:hypothetical protein [Bacteroidales bacterium]MDY0141859.1 hypothetical protein [Bacteroidales bacterium]
MLREIVLVVFMGLCFMGYCQENNLDEFVAEQQAKLVYDQSKLIQAPNTNVFLIPPEHFVADPTINGFVHPGSATTIQIIEIPDKPYTVIDEAMSETHIKSQGYIYKERQEIITETGKKAAIYFVGFTSNDVEYERVMFFTGEQKTVWININYPLSIKKLVFPAVVATLKSVQ